MIRMAILENECRRDTRLCLERGNVEYCQIHDWQRRHADADRGVIGGSNPAGGANLDITISGDRKFLYR
jgi:hypothetical protein